MAILMHIIRMAPPRLGPSLLLTAALGLMAIPAAANTLVNQDPPGAMQNSPAITRDATSGHLVVAYVDNPGGGTGIGTSYSPDNGVTWIDTTPAIPAIHGLEFYPFVTNDQLALTHACFASYVPPGPGSGPSGIYTSQSPDGGIHFAGPVAIQAYPTALPFGSFPKIEADGYAGSPYSMNLYAAWEHNLAPPNAVGAPSQAWFSVSSDQGATWLAPPMVVNHPQGPNLVRAPDLAIAPDGHTYVAWVESPGWTQGAAQVWLNQSTDGGATLGTAQPILSYWSPPQTLTDAGATPTYVGGTYCSIAADPSNAQHLAVVYAADPDDGLANETRLDVGDLPPGTAEAWLLHELQPGTNISCNQSAPNFVHTVWVDHRSGADVYYHGGPIVGGIVNWSGGDIKLTTEPVGEHVGANNARVTSSGSNVYAVWDEYLGVDFVHLIYFNRSKSDGAAGTWLGQAINLDHQPPPPVTFAGDPVVSCDGANVCVAWLVGRDATHADLYANFSTSAGDPGTWQASEIPVRAGGWVHWHDIAQTGSTVYLVWGESDQAATQSEVYFSRSTDSGLTWSPRFRLDHAPAGTITYAPRVVCSGANVYVLWMDQRHGLGLEDPYFQYSHDFGLSWQPADTRLSTGVAAGLSRDYRADLACAGNYVAAIYESNRASVGGPEDIYVNVSTDGGLSWLNPDQRMDVGSAWGARHSAAPRIALWDDTWAQRVYFYPVWMDQRNPAVSRYDIYGTWFEYDYATLPGQWTWPAFDYMVNSGAQPGAQDAYYPFVACDWTGPVYVWRDERNGSGDIYANQFRTGPDEGDILFSESFDRGATWSAAQRVNDDPTTNDQFHPWLDIKPNGIIDVTWNDNRNDLANDQQTDVFLAARLPGAAAFNPNVQVTAVPSIPPAGNWFGDYIGIEVDATDAHLVWADTRRAGDGVLGDIMHMQLPNPQFGACCFPGAECSLMLAADCLAAGGNFLGAGTVCDPNPCPYPEPRVCCVGSECHLVNSEAECAQLGGLFYPEWLSCDPNPCALSDCGTHCVGNCSLTVTDAGILGFLDMTQAEGCGFVYPAAGVNQLFLGSLWVGREASYVANNDYDGDPEQEWVVSTDPDGHIWIEQPGHSDQDIHAGFTDQGGRRTSLGLYVEQTSWAWSAPEIADDLVILRYTIENRSGAPLTDLYAGVFLDLDLAEAPYSDFGFADPAEQLACMTDSATGLTAGVVLLQPDERAVPLANVTLVHNPTYVWPLGYVSDADKFGFLSADPSHIQLTATEGDDHSVLASAGPFSLPADESCEIAFGIVAGMDPEQCRTHARVAQMLYRGGVQAVPAGDEPGGSPPAAGRTTRLLPSRPNPFRGNAALCFELDQPRAVTLAVFDISGRRVRPILHHQLCGAGQHRIAWDGRDGGGRRLAGGIYYLRFQAGPIRDSHPLILLR